MYGVNISPEAFKNALKNSENDGKTFACLYCLHICWISITGTSFQIMNLRMLLPSCEKKWLEKYLSENYQDGIMLNLN